MTLEDALPSHVAAVFRAPAVWRALVRALATPGHVALVAGRGASVPELPAGVTWHSVEAVRVAGVPLAFASGLAGFRAASAAEQLATDPPDRCRWCLYLDAGLRCAVVPFPVVRSGATVPPSPSTPPEAA